MSSPAAPAIADVTALPVSSFDFGRAAIPFAELDAMFRAEGRAR